MTIDPQPSSINQELSTMPLPCVIAIDPGRAKCGVTVVDSSKAVLHRAIVSVDRIVETISVLHAQYSPEALVIGNGTNSTSVLEAIAARLPDVRIEIVGESHTSELARARYVAETPAHGLQRLLPRSLRYPDAPYDDYVAIMLAERWWDATSSGC